MAQNTLSLLSQEIGDRLNIDYTISSNQSRITRWLNYIQNDISSRYPFSFLYNNTFIQTVTDQTVGTITTIKGNTGFVGLGTAFTTLNAAGCYLQVANDTNWYEVSSVSGQTLTCTEPAVTSASGLTYTLRTTYYDLPANCWKVFDVRQTNTPLKLTCLGIYTIDEYQPDINVTSNPTGYFLFGDDPKILVSAAKQQQIAFFPTPDNLYNIQIRYLMETSDLSASTDITIIPPRYTGVLLDGAEWLGNKFLNDPNETQLKQAYEYSLQKMIESENANGDFFPVLQSSDVQSNTSRFLPFPGNFPDVTAGDF